MEICTCSSTFLLALLLTFSVQGLAVVARVRLAGTRYVILEQQQEVCIDVINDDYNPQTAIDFTVTYMYDTVLSGISGSNRRSDQLFFSSSSNTAQICIRHHDDMVPCEANITGEVNLDGSDFVAIGHPNSAQVTIMDDDFINASFVKASYVLLEGGNNLIMPLVNTSESSTKPVVLDLLQESTNVKTDTIGRSLYFEATPITLQNTQEGGITLDIRDDDIALEDPEEVVLHLSVSSQSSCSNVHLSPLRLTRILIIDNDNVTVKLTRSSGTILEGESYPVCVVLSRRIARRLDVLLRIHSNTADLSTIETDRNVLTFTSTSELTTCMVISTIQDRVIASDRSFRVELSVMTVLPASLQRNLQVGVTSSTITIQDTSTCTDVFLDPSNADFPIYVQMRRTLCFSCTSCNRELSWNLTSYHGHIWAGKSNEQIHSENSLPFRGEVLANGNLLIQNSSLVFSAMFPGILSFSEGNGSNSSVYEVYIREDVEITELTVSCTAKKEVATITCLYRGSPAPLITWFADSQPVPDGETFSEKGPQGENRYRSTLVDGSVSSTYTCRVSNRFGSQDSTVDTLRCRDIAITSAISSSTASSSLSTNYLMSCVVITFIISQYM